MLGRFKGIVTSWKWGRMHSEGQEPHRSALRQSPQPHWARKNRHVVSLCGPMHAAKWMYFALSCCYWVYRILMCWGKKAWEPKWLLCLIDVILYPFPSCMSLWTLKKHHFRRTDCTSSFILSHVFTFSKYYYSWSSSMGKIIWIPITSQKSNQISNKH